MIREVKFESQDRRIKQILAALNANGIKDIEEANAICEAHGLDPYKTCEETQPICFENAKWAYVVGCAIAIKKGCKNAAEAAEAIGIGLQAFCIPGSVADDRKVGIGHGNLAAMLLREETKCFAFLAGHESFAAAEGAIKIAAKADKVRKEPLRCILNGLGKDAAQIISRINGFTYVQTQFDYYTGELRTRPASSTRLPVLIRKNAYWLASRTSQWHPVVVLVVLCTRTTWLPDRLLTV